MNLTRTIAAAIILGFIGLESCGEPTSPPRPAAIQLVGGGGQTDTVGQLLPDPLVVKVTTASGGSVKGVSVAFTVTSGGGTLSAASALTDSLGNASVRWTLGTTAGSANNRAAASVQGLTGSPVEFLATAVPDRPSSIALVAGSGQSGVVGEVLPQSLAVATRDEYGNGTESVVVAWAVRAGGGTLSASADTTDIAGRSAVSWTIGTASGIGRDTATATVPGLSGSPLMFVANANASSPADLAVVSGNDQSGTVGTALADSFVVRVRDQYGNPVLSAPVNWTVTRGGGSISSAVVTTGDSGRAAALRTLGTLAGRDSTRVDVTGLSSVLFGAIANPGPPANVSAISGAGQTGNLGQPLADSLVAKVTDQYGNGIVDQPVVWTVIVGGGSNSPDSGTTDSTGVVAASWSLGARLDTTHYAQASSHSLGPALFGATPMLPVSALLLRVSGDGQVDTVEDVLAESLVVRLQLADGRPVTGGSITWSTSDDRGDVKPPTVRTDLAGLARTQRTVGRIPGPGASYAFIAPIPAVSFAHTGLLPISALSAGLYHTCALRANGVAYCWGDNSYAQLGINALGGADSTPVAVADTFVFGAVSPGYQHSCGLTPAGAAYCWGTNGNGQLGTGSTTGGGFGHPVPVFGQSVYAAISAGKVHTCAITSVGDAYCWGYGFNGQLGTGSTAVNQPTPAPVSGGLTFAVISAGGEHTCGITTTGTTYCWGSNTSGQTGDSTNTTRITPVIVVGDHSFVSISAGESHTCAVTTADIAYCWGRNTEGELGDSTTASRNEPTRVAAGTLTFRVLSTGTLHTCGLTLAGAAYCWGRNDLGQLGLGYISDPVNPLTSPFAVTGGHTFVTIHAGAFHTCGLETDGLAYCWGYGFQGQLGQGSTADEPTPVRVKYQP